MKKYDTMPEQTKDFVNYYVRIIKEVREDIISQDSRLNPIIKSGFDKDKYFFDQFAYDIMKYLFTIYAQDTAHNIFTYFKNPSTRISYDYERGAYKDSYLEKIMHYIVYEKKVQSYHSLKHNLMIDLLEAIVEQNKNKIEFLTELSDITARIKNSDIACYYWDTKAYDENIAKLYEKETGYEFWCELNNWIKKEDISSCDNGNFRFIIGKEDIYNIMMDFALKQMDEPLYPLKSN